MPSRIWVGLVAALVPGAAGAEWADILGSGKAVSKSTSGTRSDPAFGAAVSTAPAVSWSQWLGNDHGSPVIADGKVYIGIGSGGLVRLGLASGTVEWASGLGPIQSAPTIGDDGRVYFQSDAGVVGAASSATGALVWSGQVDGAAGHWGAVTVGEGKVHYATMGARFGALDAASGTPIWSYVADSSVFTGGALAPGRVFHCSESTIVYAMNSGTGGLLWSDVPSDKLYGSAVLANGRLFVGAGQTEMIYAYGASTGVLLWSYPAGSPVYATAAHANGVVYAGSSAGRILALADATGALAWSYDTNGEMHSSPAVGGDTLYATTDMNRLWALDAQTGALRWTCSTGDAPYSAGTGADRGRWGRASIALSDGWVVFPSANGKVHGVLAAGAGATATPTPAAVIAPTAAPSAADPSAPALSVSTNLAASGAPVRIAYRVPEGSSQLDVLNAAGELVAPLLRVRGPRADEFLWGLTNESGAQVASGIYVLRLSAPRTKAAFVRLAVAR